MPQTGNGPFPVQVNPRASGRAYFIGNGEPVNLWELVDRILALADLASDTRSIPRGPAVVLSRSSNGSTEASTCAANPD